jgi:hypothetical protein
VNGRDVGHGAAAGAVIVVAAVFGAGVALGFLGAWVLM